ncbi:unnamed protein product [Clonostachys rosea f. rosea IK726]|uniref:Homeobox domain-containing protein n=2 Tax=Bionectria ochroleuca TaxID=29856 RepID=A0A0B7KM36_BIOOC|nr:unnamed protein product [Clonostachys rosea f. rosea IK726]
MASDPDTASSRVDTSPLWAGVGPEVWDFDYDQPFGSSSQPGSSDDYPPMPDDEFFIDSDPSYSDSIATEDPVLQIPNWLSQEYSSDGEPRTLQQSFQNQESLTNLLSLTRDRTASLHVADSEATAAQPQKRFSTASIRVLNRWLSSHINRPYPTVGDVEIMQKQSGLNKKQILTWFANARRRKKLWTPASTSKIRPPSDAAPRENLHTRPPTPIIQQMDPFERWRNSPPEHEPASVPAIARALMGASKSFEESPDNMPEDGRSHSISSSITGAETFHSSQSSRASGYSHSSGGSTRLSGFTRKKKRRAFVAKKIKPQETLVRACHPYQCTFCTETFKTKHTWQRHEKSLHLSLEQWECAPTGSPTVRTQSGLVCVYCGLADPQEAHFDTHNHHACQKRLKEERIFSRKDHLGQHLRLVHNSQFMKGLMEEWKSMYEQIRSRCGFCDLEMDTWTERASHLAGHFKEGSTMADWKGSWGFDEGTLDMVENSIQPYLIEYERNSPLPFTTQQGTPYSPGSAFELIEVELEYFFTNYTETTHCEPSAEILHYEACCIIFGAEILSQDSTSRPPSWLRELLISSEEITKKAKMRPMKSAARSRITPLKIHGKNDIFEDCKLEASLYEHVRELQEFDVDPDDSTLQRQACIIIKDMSGPSEVLSKLLINLLYCSTLWLAQFRLRVGLGPTTSVPLPQMSIAMPAVEVDRGLTNNDENVYRGLWRRLSRFVLNSTSPFNPSSHTPTDEELQYQARWIIYDSDDPWNQTPADNPDWLREFKKETGLWVQE